MGHMTGLAKVIGNETRFAALKSSLKVLQINYRSHLEITGRPRI